MKTNLKISLLSLLAIAAFVPQQSHAVNWKQWAAIGAGALTTGYLGYKIYQFARGTWAQKTVENQYAVFNNKPCNNVSAH